jgi:predicted ATPase
VVTAASAVFVGRQHELRALRDAFAEAAGGRSQVVLVEGEAGIGKTT